MSPAPTYTVNCSILLTDLPLLERPAAAAAAGFRVSSSGGRSRRPRQPATRSTRSSA